MNLPEALNGIKSGSVLLTCAKHKYVAARRRESGNVVTIPPSTQGCPLCWKVYYITDYALTPANTREQRLNELEEVIHHAVEYEQKGTFGKDFELYDTKDPRFTVEYEKDGKPE